MKRRLAECVANWPDCETGEYSPLCCRFPKSCSAPEFVKESALEPLPEPPPETPRAFRAPLVSLSALAELVSLYAGEPLIVREFHDRWVDPYRGRSYRVELVPKEAGVICVTEAQASRYLGRFEGDLNAAILWAAAPMLLHLRGLRAQALRGGYS